jgi:hypothetical protein
VNGLQQYNLPSVWEALLKREIVPRLCISAACVSAPMPLRKSPSGARQQWVSELGMVSPKHNDNAAVVVMRFDSSHKRSQFAGVQPASLMAILMYLLPKKVRSRYAALS